MIKPYKTVKSCLNCKHVTDFHNSKGEKLCACTCEDQVRELTLYNVDLDTPSEDIYFISSEIVVLSEPVICKNYKKIERV